MHLRGNQIHRIDATLPRDWLISTQVCTMTMGAMLGGAAVFGGAALHGWSLIARTNTTVVVVDPEALRDPAALAIVTGRPLCTLPRSRVILLLS